MPEKAFTHSFVGEGAGVWPVMLTPYDADGDVDFEAIDRYTDALINWGSAGLFPIALSGEMYELSEPERIAVAARVAGHTAGRVPVVAAVSETGTAEQIAAEAGRVAATGVDAVVLIASRLIDESVVDADADAELRRIVQVVLDANPGTSFGIYECPLPYHRLLSTDTVAWLAHTDRFTFFKETSHDIALMHERVRAAEGTPLRVYNAGIENLTESLDVGVAGLSGWIATVYPDLAARIIELHSLGDIDAALALQAELVRVEQGMGGSYPSSAKYLVDARGTLSMRTESRWRPSSIDSPALDALVADLPVLSS